jgi:hypothetical protein
MNRYLLIACLTLASVAMSSHASAGHPGMYGFLPFGFYQPYGVQYSTSVRTPPYFALNPPVYYGARHARPYGISPFAAPPMVEPGPGYRSRLDSEFIDLPVSPAPPMCNPCVSHSKTVKPVASDVAKGPVRNNPFVDEQHRIAQN